MKYKAIFYTWLKPEGLILFLAILLRIVALFASGQWKTENYWEYGILAQNMIDGSGYSFPFTDQDLAFLPEVYPSALMPPGYVCFLLPFLLIPQVLFRNLLLFGIQISVSVLAIWLLYRYVKEKSNARTGLLFFLMAALMPDLIYASVSIGPTVFLHALFTLVLRAKVRLKGMASLYVVLLASVSIHLRSESLLIFILWFLYPIKQNFRWKNLAYMLLLGVSLLPWMFRNYLQFGRWTFASNAGINFYRGNNPGQIGDWPPSFSPEALALRRHPAIYEPEFDRLALKLAIDWVVAQPGSALGRLPEKFARFWVLDWTDPRARNIWVGLPWLFCLGLAIILPFWRAKGGWVELYLLLIAYSFIILIFFPQPRYLALVKPFFLPFSALGASKAWFFLKEKWPSVF